MFLSKDHTNFFQNTKSIHIHVIHLNECRLSSMELVFLSQNLCLSKLPGLEWLTFTFGLFALSYYRNNRNIFSQNIFTSAFNGYHICHFSRARTHG